MKKSRLLFLVLVLARALVHLAAGLVAPKVFALPASHVPSDLVSAPGKFVLLMLRRMPGLVGTAFASLCHGGLRMIPRHFR